MNIRALIPALAIAALAGCGNAHDAATTAASPPTCHQQYETWKQSAKPEAKKLESALKRVQSAGNAEDIPVLESALKQAGDTAKVLSQSPMPKCADPHGYYRQLLARITAAGDNTKSGSGLSGLLLAEAPLQAVPKIEDNLTTELDKTVGKNH